MTPRSSKLHANYSVVILTAPLAAFTTLLKKSRWCTHNSVDSVYWIVQIVTSESGERTCGCPCL